MRKVMWTVVVGVSLAAACLAGGPPGGGPGPGGPVRGGPGVRRGGPPGGFFGQFFGRTRELDVFEVARRYFDLTDEQREALDGLRWQRDGERREAERKIRQELNAKYLELIVEILPPEPKEKFKAACEAALERDKARAEARAEFQKVLEEVAKAQDLEVRVPPDYVPYSKTDLIRRYIKLTDEQREGVEQIRRDAFGAIRDKMRQVRRPRDWRDEAARRRFFEAMRKVRDEVAEETAQTVANLLNEEQKTLYEKAAGAFDTYRKKVQEADEAYEKKLIELVGEEKVRGPRRPQPRGGDQRNQRRGEL